MWMCGCPPLQNAIAPPEVSTSANFFWQTSSAIYTIVTLHHDTLSIGEETTIPMANMKNINSKPLSIIFTIMALQVLCNCHCIVEAFSSSNNNNNQYLDSLKPTSSASFRNTRQNNRENHLFQEDYNSMEDVVARTPDDHYAKHHPGAGWAGYRHPMYGGYLDHLHLQSYSVASCSDKMTNASTAGGSATVQRSITMANHDDLASATSSVSSNPSN